MVQLVRDQSIIYNANNDKQQTNVTNQLKIEKSGFTNKRKWFISRKTSFLRYLISTIQHPTEESSI